MKLKDKTTIVMGSSEKPNRYSNKALRMLTEKGVPTIAVSNRPGKAFGLDFVRYNEVKNKKIHTITLYLNPENQVEYYDYFLELQPKRIIFNPGTENLTLKTLAEREGIECLEACTLVLLTTGQY